MTLNSLSKSLAILADFREEGWPSMDLVADELLEHLPSLGNGDWDVDLRCPRFSKCFSKIPIRPMRKIGFNVDRFLNRYIYYPRHLKQICTQFDFYYVADHSYAHLVHNLPNDRTGVYCHDLDAFRCLTQPTAEPRPWWFRKIARKILSGLQSAAVVFYSTKAVHAEILQYKLLEPGKLVHAPYGVDEGFSLAPLNSEMPPELKCLAGAPWILHVGATIPRKRIDVLLDAFALARNRFPNLRLCKIGSDWTPEQEIQISRHDLARSIVHLGKVPQTLLIDAYRRTDAVLVTSDAEGFGLPVIEAMACGASVIASDIPVLRESGGSGAVFAGVGDIENWGNAINAVLSNDRQVPSQEHRLAWASQFSWRKHAEIISNAFQNLAAS